MFPAGIKVYYGERRLLLLSPNYLMDRRAHPYRRLSATLLIAARAPFTLDAGEQAPFEAQAVLIGPNVERRSTVAVNCDLVLIDVPVGSPEYAALEPELRAQPIVTLDPARFDALRGEFQRAADETLDPAQVAALLAATVRAACGREPQARVVDARVQKALALIDELPFNQVTLALLSQRLHLSESRLRHLFKEVTGCNIQHYARWAAVWRAAALWKEGRDFTDVAHEVGFYDLAHLDRAFNEVFGWNPSSVLDPKLISLVRI